MRLFVASAALAFLVLFLTVTLHVNASESDPSTDSAKMEISPTVTPDTPLVITKEPTPTKEPSSVPIPSSSPSPSLSAPSPTQAIISTSIAKTPIPLTVTPTEKNEEETQAKASENTIPKKRYIIKLKSPMKRPYAITSQEINEIKATQNRFLNEYSKIDEQDVVHRSAYTPFLAITVPEEEIDELKKNSSVESVKEDFLLEAHLNESLSVIGAPDAWSSGYTGSGYTVAILDTGVYPSHPMLSGKVVSEACYSSNNDSGDGTYLDPYDHVSICAGRSEAVTGSNAANTYEHCNNDSFIGITTCAEHGTHVAGIAAGDGTYNGVATDSDIIAINVFSYYNQHPVYGKTLLAWTSDIKAGLERVYALRSTYDIAAVNMSLGGGKYETAEACDAADGNYLKSTIDLLESSGIAVVASSGNSSYTDGIGYPACISNVVSVGSTGDGSLGSTVDEVAGSSNSDTYLDLLAPGYHITSSIPTSSYESKQGTSMAAPHVAGAWAVAKEKYPTASVYTILNYFKDYGERTQDSKNLIVTSRINLASVIDDVENKLPIYRFWSPRYTTHFYTASISERDKLINNFSNSYTFEKVIYFAIPSSQSGSIPVYRFWSARYATHFYTTSTSERDKLISNFPHIYEYEGAAYYVYPTGYSGGGTKDVYRFWSPRYATHFYTASTSERDKLISDFSHIYEYEGAVWKVPM